MAGAGLAGVLVMILAVGSIAACTPHGGDVAHAFGVRNDSDALVIVRFGGGQDFLVPPGGVGLAAQGIGPMAGPIQILGDDCARRQLVQLTTQRGYLTIGPDGVARLEESESVSIDPLDQTERCAQA